MSKLPKPTENIVQVVRALWPLPKFRLRFYTGTVAAGFLWTSSLRTGQPAILRAKVNDEIQ